MPEEIKTVIREVDALDFFGTKALSRLA